MQILQTGSGPITALAFSPTGDLAIGSGGHVRIFGAIEETLDLPATKTRERAGPFWVQIAYLPDGQLAIGTDSLCGLRQLDGRIIDWGLGAVAALSVFGNSTVVYGRGSAISGSGSVELVEFTKGKAIEFKKPTFKEPKGVRAVAAHAGVHCIAWSSGHQKVMITDPRKQDPKTIALNYTSPAIAFHPDGHTLAVAQEWGVKLFDTERLVETRTLAGHKGRVVTLAYSIDGRILATGSWDGSVRLWNAETGQVMTTYEGHTGKVYTLAFSPDGVRLAAAGEKGTIVIWDLE